VIAKDEVMEYDELCTAAWGIIANVHGGDWEKESPEWLEAAIRWRDDYFARIGKDHPPVPATAEELENAE
jgi:hypothetical protein